MTLADIDNPVERHIHGYKKECNVKLEPNKYKRANTLEPYKDTRD